ncbi:MAG: 50S ribosomal protein L31 [Candidatus Kerfeldbacteria bacterium]|nr:50S ribosomal protein L31 [Candidatus Kerfeldbacteria bacterium]
MQEKIHPTYHRDARVTCACGNSFVTGSTQKVIEVEICSNCHPFYTGKQKLVDTARRVDRYKRMVAKGEETVRTALAQRKSSPRRAKRAS